MSTLFPYTTLFRSGFIGMQAAPPSSLRGAKRRSNPFFACGAMDCFVEPVIGRTRATRWLAMTALGPLSPRNSSAMLPCRPNQILARFRRAEGRIGRQRDVRQLRQRVIHGQRLDVEA